MQRSKMRKMAKIVTRRGLATRVGRAGLTRALTETYNGKTAARLGARILRGAALLLALFMVGCGMAGKRVTTYTPTPAPTPEMVITDSKTNKELLRITTDGRRWTWSAKPEEVIIELISHSESLRQQLATAQAPKPAPVAEVVKSTEPAK